MSTKIVTRNEAWKKSKKIQSMPKVEPERVEHPDDKAMRESAERMAATTIDAFMAQLPPEKIKALVQTFADAVAEESLRAIREEFWTSLPTEEVS